MPGVHPFGMCTPSWDFSPYVPKIAVEMGSTYDSSLMADEDCYELLLDGEPTGAVELPVEWVRGDAVHLMMQRVGSLRPYTGPTDVLDIVRQELKFALDDGGLFQLAQAWEKALGVSCCQRCGYIVERLRSVDRARNHLHD